MQLEITKLEPNSNPESEYIIITSSTTVKVDDYFLLMKVVGSEVFRILSLPKKLNLEVNDTLIIYSGIGGHSSVVNLDKKFDHTFYFNSKQQLYNSAEIEGICLLNKNDSCYTII